jgi:hypothetical protein
VNKLGSMFENRVESTTRVMRSSSGFGFGRVTRLLGLADTFNPACVEVLATFELLSLVVCNLELSVFMNLALLRSRKTVSE